MVPKIQIPSRGEEEGRRRNVRGGGGEEDGEREGDREGMRRGGVVTLKRGREEMDEEEERGREGREEEERDREKSDSLTE